MAHDQVSESVSLLCEPLVTMDVVVVCMGCVLMICSWREWSADRFMFYWGLFLEKPEARQDPQYELISNLYQQVKDKTTAAGAKASAGSSSTSSTATATATSTSDTANGATSNKKKRGPGKQPPQQPKVTQMDGTIQP